jgi:rhodanese-related sulfurtransferase
VGFEPAASSAFRALGLAASASQEDVFGAAEALRLALKLGVERKFETDLAWLGPVPRSEADVRDALGRLSDPPRRAAERLFWFHRPLQTARPVTLAGLRGERDLLLAAGGPAAVHDAALFLLAALHALDPQFKETDAWADAFRLWRETVEGEEFWSMLVAADLKGEFEQTLTFGEAAALRAETPRLVSKAVADAAQGAAVVENFDRCGRAFAVLRAASLPRALLDEYENEILGPVEQSVEDACGAAFLWARLFAQNTEMVPSDRKRYFDESLHRFDKGGRPELFKLYEVAGPESFHLRRVLRYAAAGLVELAGLYRAEGWTEQAVYVYREGRALAPPDSAEAAEAEEGLRAMNAAGGLKERTEEEYADGLAGQLRERRRPADLFPPSVMSKTVGAGGLFKGCLPQLAYCAIIVVVFFCLAWFGIIKPNPSPRFPVSTFNYNFRVPVPQFTPVMPNLSPLALGVAKLTPAELQKRLRSRQAVVVDVRARAEYEAGHIPGALFVPREAADKEAASLRRRGRQVVCYGSSSDPYQSLTVALGLRVDGLKNVALLEGEFEAWVAAGLPTETEPGTVTPRSVNERGVKVAPPNGPPRQP